MVLTTESIDRSTYSHHKRDGIARLFTCGIRNTYTAWWSYQGLGHVNRNDMCLIWSHPSPVIFFCFLVNIFIQDNMDTCTQHATVSYEEGWCVHPARLLTNASHLDQLFDKETVDHIWVILMVCNTLNDIRAFTLNLINARVTYTQ